MHMILCHASIDKLTRIKVGGKTVFEGAHTGGRLTLDAEEIFGGEKKEGGISGDIDVETGDPGQPANDYLASVIEPDIPAFRGVFGIVLRHTYVGMNPYLKPWEFKLQRVLKTTDGQTQWNPSKALIEDRDMNPAHIIRECLVDKHWGMGYDESDIDDVSFTAAANTLFAEQFGLSLLWTRQEKIEKFVKNVSNHIDATVFVNRQTGKFTIKLIRDDYDPNNLKVLDKQHIEKVDNFTQTTIDEAINSYVVNYHNTETDKTGSVRVENMAVLQQQGNVIQTKKQYNGITTAKNALRAAERDLRILSTPLAAAKITVNRHASHFNIGDVFKFAVKDYFPDVNHAADQIVMRITDLSFGDQKNHRVKIICVQDIFSLPQFSTFDIAEVPDWEDPNTGTQGAGQYGVLVEAPYYEVVQQLGETEAQSRLEQFPDIGFFITSESSPSSIAQNGQFYVDAGAGFELVDDYDFMPAGQLSGNMDKFTTVITIKEEIGLSAVDIGTHAQIGDELIRIDAIEGNNITIGRGVIDTIPVEHSDSDQIYFWDDVGTGDGEEYVLGESIAVKRTPFVFGSYLPLADATAQTLTFDQRAARPYPPGNVKVNGSYSPSISSVFNITWVHRNKEQQTGGSLLSYYDGGVTPGDELSYRIRMYDETNALLTTIEVEGGLLNAYTILNSQLPDSGTTFDIEIVSVTNGLESWQPIRLTLPFVKTDSQGLCLIIESGHVPAQDISLCLQPVPGHEAPQSTNLCLTLESGNTPGDDLIIESNP